MYGKLKDKFTDIKRFRGAPYILENGVWNCMGETMVQTHVRMHKAGIKITDIAGYKNVGLGGGHGG